MQRTLVLGLAASSLISTVACFHDQDSNALRLASDHDVAMTECETYPTGVEFADLPSCSRARVIEDTQCCIEGPEDDPEALEKHRKCLCESTFFSDKPACHDCILQHDGITKPQHLIFQKAILEAKTKFCEAEKPPSKVFSKFWLELVDNTVLDIEEATSCPNAPPSPTKKANAFDDVKSEPSFDEIEAPELTAVAMMAEGEDSGEFSGAGNFAAGQQFEVDLEEREATDADKGVSCHDLIGLKEEELLAAFIIDRGESANFECRLCPEEKGSAAPATFHECAKTSQDGKTVINIRSRTRCCRFTSQIIPDRQGAGYKASAPALVLLGCTLLAMMATVL